MDGEVSPFCTILWTIMQNFVELCDQASFLFLKPPSRACKQSTFLNLTKTSLISRPFKVHSIFPPTHSPSHLLRGIKLIFNYVDKWFILFSRKACHFFLQFSIWFWILTFIRMNKAWAGIWGTAIRKIKCFNRLALING